jgi:hypothetical protein
MNIAYILLFITGPLGNEVARAGYVGASLPAITGYEISRMG